jgi:hypothetical protein
MATTTSFPNAPSIAGQPGPTAIGPSALRTRTGETATYADPITASSPPQLADR